MFDESFHNVYHYSSIFRILIFLQECNRLSRENKNNIEELGKMREQLILRDKLLEVRIVI